MKNVEFPKRQVALTIVLHNCTINVDVDKRQNNSTHHKKEQKGCTITEK